MLWRPETIEIAPDRATLDEDLEAVPDGPAVFLLWPRAGTPYLARTALLRRRLRRLLGLRERPSRLLNLREVASRIQYRLTASRLETNLVFYEVARAQFPAAYLKLMKLRMPAYVKLILSTRFPRTQVTTRLSGAHAVHYGPFRSRASADQYESRFLDLFQIRRCQEDLAPSPQHPGCIYGEMSMCLRPCQQAVSDQEYLSEVDRVREFLSTQGRSLAEVVAHARDRLSEEMNFEEAARQHQRLEKIQDALKLSDELARDIARLNGVAVTGSTAASSVELWFVQAGCWLAPRRFGFEVPDGKTVSLDHRLREIVSALEPARRSLRERQEHLALLARWIYSSARDGEWLAFDSFDDVPYLKLVNAIGRVARDRAAARS
jgi:excinuclease UvrABC nuclease subunit